MDHLLDGFASPYVFYIKQNHRLKTPTIFQFCAAMASPLALRRALASSVSVNRLASPVRSASGATFLSRIRSFNTDTQVTRAYEGGKSVDVDVDGTPDRSVSRRRDRSLTPFSDVFEPFFSPTRSLSQVLNLMDQLTEDPLQAFRGGSRRGWDVKEDDKALQLRIDMPGLSRDDVKVVVEQNTLIIRGEGGEREAGEEDRRRYSGRIDLPSNVYKLDEIKAEMRNGVLKVLVPKAQEGERKDVLEVPVA